MLSSEGNTPIQAPFFRVLAEAVLVAISEEILETAGPVPERTPPKTTMDEFLRKRRRFTSFVILAPPNLFPSIQRVQGLAKRLSGFATGIQFTASFDVSLW
jgi:hypothetical protein